MEQSLKSDLINDLKNMKEFLDDCDEGLAFEISGKEKIAGRIYKASQEISDIISKVQNA